MLKELMMKRMKEYEERHGEIDPRAKAIFFFAYSQGAADYLQKTELSENENREE